MKNDTEIANVNMRFTRRARGVAALSRYALSDDGGVLVSAPDEIEARTAHLVRFRADGKSEVRETYSVETLRRLEIASDGAAYIGITDDDLYLFREGRKSRFLSDRRVAYADMGLDAEGKRLVAAFSDVMASGYSLALGEIGGRALWTKDFPFVITRTALDRSGMYIAVAGATGELMILDAARATVVRHQRESAIYAVATIGPARTMFATADGVGAVDSEGGLLWFAEFDAPPVEIALDAAARTTAVLLRDSDSSGRLVFLSERGLPLWDVDFDTSRPTGVSVSADGRGAAVTLRDGTITVFELHYGEPSRHAGGARTREAADTLRMQGNWQAAAETLSAHLEIFPTDADACRTLAETLTAFRAQTLAAVEISQQLEDFAGADERLAAYLDADPMNAEIVARRRDLRRAGTQRSLIAGQSAAQSGDRDAAEAHFRAAIAADSHNADARAALSDILQIAAASALTAAQKFLAVADYPAALAALMEAGRRGADSEEVAALLRAARIGEALHAGNELYRQQQYAAALFQFKKVLRLDPHNVDAAQKISYSQNFQQNSQLSERFTRLE